MRSYGEGMVRMDARCARTCAEGGRGCACTVYILSCARGIMDISWGGGGYSGSILD